MLNGPRGVGARILVSVASSNVMLPVRHQAITVKFNTTTLIFIQENLFETVLCQINVILFITKRV